MTRTWMFMLAMLVIGNLVAPSSAQLISLVGHNRTLTAHAQAIDFDRPPPEDLIQDSVSLTTINFNPLDETISASAVGSFFGSNATASQNSFFLPNRIRAIGSARSSGEFARNALANSHFESSISLAQDLSYTMEVSLAGGWQVGPDPSVSRPSFSFVGPSGDLLRLDPQDVNFRDITDGMADAFEGFTSVSATGQLAAGSYDIRAIADTEGGISSEASYDVDFRVAPLPREFHPISSISASTSGSDLWPVSNLIQGPGVGFQAEAPFAKTSSGSAGNWVTDACGFPCDYLASQDAPVLTIDLGADRELSEIDLWGYESTNANGARAFRLRFATEAEGTNGFANSIDYTPTFAGLVNDDTNRRQPYVFDREVSARYVELTLTDNFFTAPGDGSEGEVPGGDRIGLGEIAFPAFGAILGDFDQSGILDVADIDQLTMETANGTNNPNFDLTNDGTVNFSDVQVWIKDLAGSAVGDSNVDGVFNSGDLVQVFAGGRYERNLSASWSQGDWNGDGRFDSGDLVTAFADGGYSATAIARVPEPMGSSMLLGVLLVIATRQSRRRVV